nr:integrase, catalytic region, zinc finger, CCHC-type, peptidase aspartic, catalytic [Tanacetum cinerariifolium]
MADQRTMAELLRAPTEGYAEAIVVPPIHAEQFELKHSLINMMTSDQLFGLEKDNPHDHIRWFNKITSTIKLSKFVYGALTLVMTGNLKLLINFVWKFLGTVRFRNDHVATILGFGDLLLGNILITRVYFFEGLGHNLFLVGQFCDLDLEVAFRRNTCFVRNLEGVNLLKGNRTQTFTPSISMASASLIYLMDHATSTKKPQQNGVVERRNRTLVEAAKRMLIFSRAPLFLWAKAIATIKPDISFLHVFGALCYPKNDCEDIGKLGAKGGIGFFIGYSADSCAYIVYNRRTTKIMKRINVTDDELSAIAFEQSSSKPGLQSMTSRQISVRLDLTYASSTITTQQPAEGELDLLFEAMYDDYIGGEPSATPITAPTAQAPQVRQTPMTSTTIADTAPTPINSSS